jgi:hypothetical protein
VQGADDDDDDDDEEEADEQVGRDDGAQTDDEDDMEEDAPLRAAARCYRPRRAAYACSMLRGCLKRDLASDRRSTNGDPPVVCEAAFAFGTVSEARLARTQNVYEAPTHLSPHSDF